MNTQLWVKEFGGVFGAVQASLASFAPQLILSVFVMIAGLVTAFVFRWVSRGLLLSLKRLFPQSLRQKAAFEENVNFAGVALGNSLFFIVIFLTVASVMKRLGLEVISDWLQSLEVYFPNVLAALFLFFMGWRVKGLIQKFLLRSMSTAGLNHGELLSGLLSWAFFLITAALAVEQIGINLRVFILLLLVTFGVLLGGLVLTFALGAKATVSDILACYQLHKVLKIGENVRFGETSGSIQSIGPTMIVISAPSGRTLISGSRFAKEVSTIESKNGSI